ncbi:cyclic pyranopterin monophosphate synthase MoaC [Entomomonas sp. E2T0]|uniref:cyclic pyranopterin monophosphate synthase MoaC n=1 Tax=Entomomonas sp. E2T0 TaxID=2930213 RepID=UPI0022281B2E|nr:cyclic pyranopterin monophosphate synthase MoaC [Entomomonas sp. E2T0]UYZ83630.1 cyclic pyranopterin monophosphate synthase MoaC [Entomomonas sp. E2T0]
MTKLTHFDAAGQAHMVDIAEKQPTKRQAIATGSIQMSAEAFQLLGHNASKKGDVLGIARIAAIQGAKQTSNLIPLCHPLPLTHVSVEFNADEANSCLHLQVTAETVGKTGVEMEALNAVSIGLLTVYDMLKAVDKSMCIQSIHLLKKEGGKSGLWQATE